MSSHKSSFLVVIDGKVEGVYKELKEEHKKLRLIDYKGYLIMPGFNDLHCHASQYQYRGTCFDVELMEWLDAHAFPEEAKFNDLKYAKKAYSIFVKDIKNSFTTRISLFATLHKEATLELMDQLEKTGLVSYVGLVGMDRCVPDCVKQKNVESASKDIEEYIKSS